MVQLWTFSAGDQTDGGYGVLFSLVFGLRIFMSLTLGPLSGLMEQFYVEGVKWAS